MIKKIDALNESVLSSLVEIWLETNKKTHHYIIFQSNIGNLIYTFLNEKNEIVGFLGIQNDYIAGIFIKEEYQRKGIGKSLLDQSKKDFNELTLTVYEKNQQAIAFYLSQNFNQIDQQVDVLNKENEIIMKWEKE